MADEINGLILEHLRHIRGSISRMEDDIAEMKSRLGRLETIVAQIHVTLAEHSVRFDRLEARVTQIEKRLDLAEA